MKNTVTHPIWNTKIFCTLDIFEKEIIKKDKNMKRLNASIIITHENYDINYYKLGERLKFLSCDKLHILNLNPVYDDVKIEHIIQNKYVIYNISLSNLFIKQSELFDKLFITKEIDIKSIVFIFNGYLWPWIVAAFYTRNILVSFGSTSRRGVLSNTHHRLSQFITCVEGMKSHNTINESFHNYSALATQPCFDLSNDKTSLVKIFELFIKLDEYLKLKEEYGFFEGFLKKNHKINIHDLNIFLNSKTTL